VRRFRLERVEKNGNTAIQLKGQHYENSLPKAYGGVAAGDDLLAPGTHPRSAQYKRARQKAISISYCQWPHEREFARYKLES